MSGTPSREEAERFAAWVVRADVVQDWLALSARVERLEGTLHEIANCGTGWEAVQAAAVVGDERDCDCASLPWPRWDCPKHGVGDEPKETNE